MAGTYQWTAEYPGDLNNNAASEGCGATGEVVTVTKATPALDSTASGSVPLGRHVYDVAALSGAVKPTGPARLHGHRHDPQERELHLRTVQTHQDRNLPVHRRLLRRPEQQSGIRGVRRERRASHRHIAREERLPGGAES